MPIKNFAYILCTYVCRYILFFTSSNFAGLGQLCMSVSLGCQMVYFRTKNPNLWKFSSAFLDWKLLIYFTTIWSILQTFGIFYDHLVRFVFFWYIFAGYCIIYQEKSGNPGVSSCVAKVQIVKTFFARWLNHPPSSQTGWPDWANFRLLGHFFRWAFFSYRSPIFLATSMQKSDVLILTKNVSGGALGDIFTNSSGHPEHKWMVDKSATFACCGGASLIWPETYFAKTT
jgi:hypothetical protein